jgi:hypothetical protein
MNSRDEAVQLLDHYITMIMERAGTRSMKVDSDTHVEIAQCVDAIIDAVVEKTLARIKDDMIQSGR